MIVTNKKHGAKGVSLREVFNNVPEGERRVEVQIIKNHHWYKEGDIVIWRFQHTDVPMNFPTQGL